MSLFPLTDPILNFHPKVDIMLLCAKKLFDIVFMIRSFANFLPNDFGSLVNLKVN